MKETSPSSGFLTACRKLALCLTFITSCFSAAQAQLLYGISGNNLVSFDATAPGVILNNVPVSGIAAGQVISGLDFRPNTGEMYALGYNPATGQARLYRLDPATGAVIPNGFPDITLAVNMGQVGFDFNPTVDRIRVTGSNGSNFRLHPGTGALVATDGNLAYAAADANAGATPKIGSVAYTNSFAGATTTTLYNYDNLLNVLTTQIPPNNGTLNTVGASGITLNVSDLSSDLDIWFDAVTKTNKAFFVANTGALANDELFSVNLLNGQMTSLGAIGGGMPLSHVAAFVQGLSTAPLTGRMVFALNANNWLISFDSDLPSALRSIVVTSGVEAGQVLQGIDFRPATGEMYSLGYNATTGDARLYVINRATGVATPIGAAAVNLGLNLGRIGFDFNPTVDRIRVTGSNNFNFRLHPVTGVIAATDTPLAFAAGDVNAGINPNVGAIAYSNSFIGATTTTLYNYDDSLHVFTTQIPPNNGTLNTIGASGITVNAADLSTGFDIYFDSASQVNLAYFSANTGTSMADMLYTVNLMTGAATASGTIGAAVAVKDIALLIRRFVPGTLSGEVVYGLTGNNSLITFDSDKPGIIRTLVPTSGVAAGQVLSGMDFRPLTGELYGLGYNAMTGETRLYKIDRTTGVATPVGAAAINLGPNLGIIGMDFNPVVDRIRVTTSTGGNFRLHPDTGALAATDTPLAFATGDPNSGATPDIGASAYSNSFNGTTATTLYNLALTLNVLTRQAPPNDGTLNTVGALGITLDATDRSFDLDIFYQAPTMSNLALMSANILGKTTDALYTVNLTTGAATSLGNIGLAVPVKNIAVFTRRPDLSVTISANPVNYTQYVNVTYTVTVTNSGDVDATRVSVAAGLPTGMVHTSNAVTKGTYDPFLEVWDVGTLAPGESATLTLVLFPLVNDPTIVNFVQVLSQDQQDADSTPGNDVGETPDEDDEAAVTVLGPTQPPGGITADLSLTASVENSQYDIYVPVTYTVTLTNSGPDAANFIRVQAGLPQGFVHTGNTVTGGEYNLFFQRWDIPSLAAGQSIELKLVLFPLIDNAPTDNFFQVLASGQTDPDSTPGNGVCCTANEDDEANVTITPNFGGSLPPTDNLLINFDENGSAAAVFPTPASLEIRVQAIAGASDSDAFVRIYDSAGRVVHTLQTELAEGFNEWTFDVSNFRSGVYFVQLPGMDKVLRFLKM